MLNKKKLLYSGRHTSNLSIKLSFADAEICFVKTFFFFCTKDCFKALVKTTSDLSMFVDLLAAILVVFSLRNKKKMI